MQDHRPVTAAELCRSSFQTACDARESTAKKAALAVSEREETAAREAAQKNVEQQRIRTAELEAALAE